MKLQEIVADTKIYVGYFDFLEFFICKYGFS